MERLVYSRDRSLIVRGRAKIKEIFASRNIEVFRYPPTTLPSNSEIESIREKIKSHLIDMELFVPEKHKISNSTHYGFGIRKKDLFGNNSPRGVVKDPLLEATIIDFEDAVNTGDRTIKGLLQIGITRFSEDALVTVGVKPSDRRTAFEFLSPECVFELDWTKDERPARTLIMGIAGVEDAYFRIIVLEPNTRRLILKDSYPKRFSQKELAKK